MADGIYQSVMCFFMPYFMYRPVNFETMSGLNISDRTKTGCVVAACAILSTNFYVMFNSYKVNHKPPPTTATRNQSWIQSTKKSSSSNKRAHNTWFFTGNGCKSCITTMMMMMVVVVCVSRLCYAPFFFFFFLLGHPCTHRRVTLCPWIIRPVLGFLWGSLPRIGHLRHTDG